MQRARKWRQSGRETLASHEVGRASATVRSLRELELREEKGGGEGIHSMRRRPSSCVPKRRKRRGKGGSSTRVRVGVESRQGVEKREKAHCTSAAQPNKSGTQVGLGINSVRHKEQKHSIDL